MSIDITKPIVDQMYRDIAVELIAQGARPSQVTEMGKSFYSAVHRTLLFLRDEVADLPAEQAEGLLEQMLAECEWFVEGGWRKWKCPGAAGGEDS